ncbi:hypothetical protein KQI88_02260 [Alkaliphilus sp. MSJ-5]|uniref:Uncharacterized protein n=1 Tax=Alkaliphilus flagellatus TaxID=2841507 RepID=A0ABS6G1I8_9FIRM|nr:hypothetical protein [Alkaliphilus flagellatus]MBU5675240.1 hypothetical protein [Alkaliphilus flagellatus]
MYKKSNFVLKSDFEIREIRQEDENGDVDLFIPIEYKTVNLFLPFIKEENMSRIQLSEVKSIVIRFNTSNVNNRCSIHFLKNIDLLSHLLNFELDYEQYAIIVKQEEYSVSFKLIEK